MNRTKYQDPENGNSRNNNLDFMIGMKIGKLTIKKRTENFEGSTDSRSQFLCECECGNEVTVVGRNFRRGKLEKKACFECRADSYGGNQFTKERNVNGFLITKKYSKIK